jgi:catechol 2,3-dioxygenase-like lactoylglutathione lyase family enzyme
MLDRPRPRKLGHLVLKVRDIRKSVKFYTEIVGLEVSDWIEDKMVFLRCGKDHHDLGLFQLPPDAAEYDGSGSNAPGLEHLSYEVEDYEEIKRIVAFLQEKGVEIVRGPGKHGPGENIFLVFRDPDGNYVEFYCEMIQITGDKPYEANVWDDNLDAFDQWHFKEFAVEPPPLYLEVAKKSGVDLAKTKKNQSA